jgi:hypothetical protein
MTYCDVSPLVYIREEGALVIDLEPENAMLVR